MFLWPLVMARDFKVVTQICRYRSVFLRQRYKGNTDFEQDIMSLPPMPCPLLFIIIILFLLVTDIAHKNHIHTIEAVELRA